MTVRQFETIAGLSNGFVSKERDHMRPGSLEKISNHFSELNIQWLKTGLGEMIKEDYRKESFAEDSFIPVYGADIVEFGNNIVNDSGIEPISTVCVPDFKNCDCALIVSGRAMIPDINDGSIVAVKEIEIEMLLPGEAYVILTSEYRVVRYVRHCQEDSSKLRLVPRNVEEFDETLIDKNKIDRLFLIKGVITSKVL